MVYKWYILPIGGLYATAPTFFRGTPGNSIDSLGEVVGTRSISSHLSVDDGSCATLSGTPQSSEEVVSRGDPENRHNFLGKVVSNIVYLHPYVDFVVEVMSS